MYQSLDLFRIAGDMARYAGTRQALTARNVANADTPGYVAQNMPGFAETYQRPTDAAMRGTRAGHLGLAEAAGMRGRTVETMVEPSPSGNAVSIEEEMLSAIEIGREHSRALAIYQHTMTVLRTSLGR